MLSLVTIDMQKSMFRYADRAAPLPSSVSTINNLPVAFLKARGPGRRHHPLSRDRGARPRLRHPARPHFMMEFSSQLLCCLPHAHILENIDGGSLTDLGALAQPIRITDGWFTPPNQPGHGISFDRAVLAGHAVES